MYNFIYSRRIGNSAKYSLKRENFGRRIKMKSTKISAILVLVSVVFFFCPGFSKASSSGTAFTYQGRFYDAGYPLNGQYDLQFKLYDAPKAGSQKGSAIILNGFNIVDGYFTAELDFGSVFDSNDRWLQISIRPAGPNDTNAYVTVTPRQKVTANISSSRPISTVSSDTDLADDAPALSLSNGSALDLMSASPVKQVIRGVISFEGCNYEVTQAFSPSIDPSKSVVLLSKCVEKRTTEPGRYYTLNHNGACLLSLGANSITVTVDYSDLTPNIYPQRVSYQIIEYK
jgi:hypothetical protein